MKKQVFISYRQESPEHSRSVRKLAELLRQAQLPVMLDQFYLEDNPGGPNEGWPKWCADCAKQSACVIIIASEGWFAAFEGKETAPSGYGVATEAHLFRQILYDNKNDNDHIRLAFLHDIEREKISTELRAWHEFHPNDPEQKNQLIRWAADCLGINNVEIPTVNWPQPISFKLGLADRKDEWPIIKNLLTGQQTERIVLIEGNDSGLGKSALLHETQKYSKQLGIKTVWIELKWGAVTVDALLDQFDLDLDSLLPNFSRDDAKKVKSLRKDFRALRHPILIIFDSYEDVADNPMITDWINRQLLNEVETSPAICVIIAGQKTGVGA